MTDRGTGCALCIICCLNAIVGIIEGHVSQTSPDPERIESSDDPAMMLAIDEACLMAAEAGEVGQSFRTWQLSSPAVILGRSSKVDKETDRAYCEQHGIPIFRRCSGGASVVGGPGCLMYSVVLSFAEYPAAAKIDGAHQLVMSRIAAAVQRQLPDARMQGICDLTWQSRKFSGNALRLTRCHVLYHGTILYRTDLDLVARCLDFAPRQPDYRQGRPHRAFITNIPVDPGQLRDDLAWQFGDAADDVSSIVKNRAIELADTRYRCPKWRFRH